MRGFSVIALDNPKSPENVGGAQRACHCYGAQLMVVSGARGANSIRHATNTFRAWKHMPTVCVADVFDAIPFDCVPVAVDLIDGATPLPRYKHPERAFYIFGAEDQTLSERIVGRCKDVIVVPTRQCMNLAATVNVVLYDRLAKRGGE